MQIDSHDDRYGPSSHLISHIPHRPQTLLPPLPPASGGGDSMQQPTHHPVAPGPAIPPASITTEQIQKYLEENNQLILALLENQNLGKLAECAQYQAQLQKNLLFLAAIADAQPQAPTVHPQMLSPAAMQQGGHYMQRAPIFPSRPSFNPHQVQEQQQQQLNHHPQMMPFQGHIGMRPGIMNGMHAMRTEASHGGINVLQPGPSMSEFRRGGTASNSVDGQGSKQDVGGAASESAVADGHRNSASDHGNGDAESTQVKRPEDSKTS